MLNKEIERLFNNCRKGVDTPDVAYIAPRWCCLVPDGAMIPEGTQVIFGACGKMIPVLDNFEVKEPKVKFHGKEIIWDKPRG